MTHPASLNLPARTPLPTEQERYLDMLLMVREAMRQVFVEWRDGPGEAESDLVHAGYIGELCWVYADSVMAGDPIERMEAVILELAGKLWIQYTGIKEARTTMSETVASFAN